jgi:hypothetical protein
MKRRRYLFHFAAWHPIASNAQLLSPSSIVNMSVIWKYLIAWLVMLLVSIANGAARDLIYARQMGELAAHQLSTLIGVLLLGLVIHGFVRRYPPSSGPQAVAIGLGWLALTLAFEFLFFHYVGGHPWSALLANYDISAGRVWIVVPLWVAIAPYVFFRFHRSA